MATDPSTQNNNSTKSQSSPSSIGMIADQFLMLVVRTIYRTRIDIGNIKYLMIVLNFLYIAALTDPITPTYSQQDSSESLYLPSSLSWYEFYKLFYIIARPTTLLRYYSTSSFDTLLVSCIGIFFLLIFTAAVCSLYFRLTKPSTSTSNLPFTLMKIVLSFGNVFNYFLLTFFTETLSTIGIHSTFDSSATSEFGTTPISIISLLLLLCVLGFVFFSLQFGELCITHDETGLFRNNSTSMILFVQTLIKFVLAMLSGFDGTYSYNITLPLMWSFSIIYLACVFYEFFIDAIPFSEFRTQTFFIVSATQALILTVLSLLKKDDDDGDTSDSHIAENSYTLHLISTDAFLTIVLLVSIPCQHFMSVMWNNRRNKIFVKITSHEAQLEKGDHKIFAQCINMLNANEEELMQQRSVFKIGIYEQHRKYCNDTHCFCAGDSHVGILKGMDEQSALLSTRVYEQMLRMYMRNDLRLIDVFVHPEDTLQFLRYMDHFLHVKKHTFALQNIIEIQIESEKLKKPMQRRTRLSLAVLLEILKETMSKDIQRGITDLTVETTSKAIAIYIQMEAMKSDVRQRLYQCLEQKKLSLERMQKSFEFSQEVEDLNSNYTQFLETTETMLFEFYNRFTTPNSQLLVVFFESEIKGNLKRAHIVKQARKQSDIAEYLNSKNMFIEVFSPDVVSITSTAGKKLGRIVGYSDKTPAVFGYEKQEFDFISDIKDLLPITLARMHDEMVRFMMIRGRYNVVHIARNVFLRNRQNFIFQVRVFADINFYYTEELPFIFMVKVLATTSSFLIVNSSGCIEGICQNFFRSLDQPIQQLPFAYKIDVQWVFPKFTELAAKLKPFVTEDHPNSELSFPPVTSSLFSELFYKTKPVRFKDAAKEGMLGTDSVASHMSVVQQAKLNSYENELIRFKSMVSLQKRVLQTTKGDLVYYVVEIKNIQIQRSYNNDLKSCFSMSKQTSVMRFQQRDLNGSIYSKQQTNPTTEGALSSQEFEDNSPKGNRTQEGTKSARLADNQQIIVETELESQVSLNSNDEDPKQGKTKKKKKKKSKNGDILDASINQNDSMRKFIDDKGNNYPITQRAPQQQETNDQDLQNQNGYKQLSTHPSNFSKLPLNGLSAISSNDNQIVGDSLIEKESTQPRQPSSQIVNVDLANQNAKNNINDRSPRGSKNDSQNQQKKQSRSQNQSKSKINESSYQRYRQQQRANNDQSMREVIVKDLSDDPSYDGENKQRIQLASSISGDEADKTKQIDKFSYFETFAQSKSKPPSLMRLQILKVIEFATMILYAILFALSVNNSLEDLDQRAQAILLKASILPHISTFTSAEFLYRQVDDNSSFPSQSTVLEELLSIEEESYTMAYSNISYYYVQSYFKPEFVNQEITLLNPYMVSESTSTSPSSSTPDYSVNTPYANFSEIDSFAQLSYHMQTLNSVEDNGSNILHTNSVIFIQHNYHSFIEASTSLMLSQYNDTIDAKDTLYTTLIIVSCLMIAVQLIFFFVINVNFGTFQRIMTQILNVITTVKTTSVEHEILRVRNIMDSMKESEEIFEQFTFSIRRKEHEMQLFTENEEKTGRHYTNNGNSISSLNQNSSRDQRKRKLLNIQINSNKLSSTRFYAISSFGLMLFIIYQLLNLILNVEFLNSYNSGLQYLSNFGEMTFIVPSLLSYSCLIYDSALSSSSATALSSSEVTYTKTLFENAITDIGDFTQSVSSISTLSIFSSSFSSSFNAKLGESLCTYIGDSSSQCTSNFNGALTSGLVNALTFWKQEFTSIQGVDFENSDTSDFYTNLLNLLRYSIVVNKAQKMYTQEVYNQIQSVIQSQKNLVIILAIVFSSLLVIPKLYEFMIESKSISLRFFVAKKIVFLLPLYTLMIEETFAKILKALGQHLDLKR